MREVAPGLFIGDVNDCRTRPDGVAVVHACKYPCYHDKFGQPAIAAPNYLCAEQGDDLWLNIVDPDTPLFQLGSFTGFRDWYRRKRVSGQSVLIHCNCGKSRAPSLALVAMAKVDGLLRNGSYDMAWDDFETAHPGVYQPSQGIETWLRNHWSEIQAQAIDRPAAAKAVSEANGQRVLDRAYDDFTAMTPEERLAVIRNTPLVHFGTSMQIELADKTWGIPTPNILQRRMNEAYLWCRVNKQKCRMIVLKFRKAGSSTFSAELCYHHLRRYHANMLLMGDNEERTKDIFKIFNGYHTHDNFAWDSTYAHNTEKGTFHYADKTMGAVQTGSAMAKRVGIGGTRTVLWLTESARYAKTGERKDTDVIQDLLNSVPDVENVLIIAESTAEGVGGWFHKTFLEAVSLEDRKKNRVGNSWIKIFAGWHEFPENRLKRGPQNEEYFNPKLDDREKNGVRLYKWSLSQVAWRRAKIATDCNKDAKKFDQDFPESADVAFLSSGRPRFNLEGVSLLEKAALENHDKAERGIMQEGLDKQVAFLPSKDGEAWVWCSERPTYNLRYIGFIDCCGGEQSEGATNPDSHAAGIIRAGYFNAQMAWHPPKLVAAIDVHGGCRWEFEMMGERLCMLLKWYGNCMVIPEINGVGVAMIDPLRKHGALIYRRKKTDNVNPGKLLETVGFDSGGGRRNEWVQALATAIEQQEFVCTYLPAVQQFKVFIVNDRGKAEARQGEHDDWICGCGLGLYAIDLAQVLQPPAPAGGTEQGGQHIGAGLRANAFS